jgi:hypothetical protein
MVAIRSELRVVDDEPEIWTNLADILDWLDTLQAHTNNAIAASVAGEIRDLLHASIGDAERQVSAVAAKTEV